MNDTIINKLGEKIDINNFYNSKYKSLEYFDICKNNEKFIVDNYDTDILMKYKKYPCIYLKLDNNNKLILECKICKLTILCYVLTDNNTNTTQIYKCEIINDENNLKYTSYFKNSILHYSIYETQKIKLERILNNRYSLLNNYASYLRINNKNIYYLDLIYNCYINKETNIAEYILSSDFYGLAFYKKHKLYGIDNDGSKYMYLININKKIYSDEEINRLDNYYNIDNICFNNNLIKIEKVKIEEDMDIFYKYIIKNNEIIYDLININNDIIDNIYIKLNSFMIGDKKDYNSIIYKKSNNKFDIIKNILNKKYINNFELSDIYCYFNKKIYLINNEKECDNIDDAKLEYTLVIPNINVDMINIYNNKSIKIKTKYLIKPIKDLYILYKNEVKLNILKLYYNKFIYSNNDGYFKMEKNDEYNIKYKFNDIIYIVDLREIDSKDINLYKNITNELVKNIGDIIYGYIYLDNNNDIILYIYDKDKYIQKIDNEYMMKDEYVNDIYISNILKTYFNNITDIKKLKDIGIEGFIYNITLNNNINNNIIIKIPQNEKNKNKLLCEYTIGLNTVNKIRQIIPTFMFTYGSVECPINENIKIKNNDYKLKCNIDNNNQLYIFNEYINGKTLKDLFEYNDFNFENFLIIYIQILLSLELSQKEHSFTHYDLHRKNVMVKDVNNYTYKIVIENSVYEFKNIKQLPVIIDFGNSTSIINNKSIGTYSKLDKFIFPFLLNGVDMYKLLLWSVHTAKNNLKKEIKNLFKFYYDDGLDVYNIYNNSDNNIRNAINKYGSKIFLNDKILQLTPLDFFNWINKQKKYKDILNKYINIYNKNYYFNNEQIVLTTNKNIYSIYDNNYIINNLIQYIYNSYNNIYNNININKLTNINNQNINNQNINNYLDNYKNIIIPSYNILDYMCNEILNLKLILDIDTSNIDDNVINKLISEDKNKKIELINKFKILTIFYNYTKLYIDIYLELKQLHITDYVNFINEFNNSEQYKTYFLYKDKISKVLRWCESIEKSLDIIKYIKYTDKNEMYAKIFTYKDKLEYEREQYIYINNLNNLNISNCLLNNICNNIDQNKNIINTRDIDIYNNIEKEINIYINNVSYETTFINNIKNIVNNII
jgi:hypothetical protein